MRRSRLLGLGRSLLCAQLLTFASAQDNAASSAAVSGRPSSTSEANSQATSSATAAPKVHHIAVGNGAFVFEPAELHNVSVGDTVTFDFYPPDHGVARAEFGRACVPYEYTGRNKTGFFSGVYLFDDPLNPIPWNLTINSTEPIFFYCVAPGSCIDKQMVGVINPNDTQTLDRQIEYAKDSEFSVVPGEELPSEASSTLSATPGATAPPAQTPHHSGGGSKLSGGAIAGIVVGAVAFLAICAALFFFVGRTKSLKEVLERKDATVTTHVPGEGGPEMGNVASPHTSFAGGTAPYSPHQSMQPSEYGHLPGYSQHNATDQHPSGWASPDPRHLSMSPQPQDGKPVWAAEMPSPDPHQQTFTAELEAPIKSPR